jgi:hypothetical protein
MLFNSNAFRITAFLFILVVVLIVLIKPSFFFNDEGDLKSFGLNYSDQTTPIPLYVFIYGFLVLTYGIVVLMESKIQTLLSQAATAASKTVTTATEVAATATENIKATVN